MQQVIFKYASVAHIFLLATFLVWVHGGANPTHLSVVPWLCFGTLEMMFLLPPLRKNETLEAARRRTVHETVRDPILWLAGGMMLYLLLQTLNGGCELVYNSETDAWAYSQPPLRGMPYCIVPSEARPMLYWILAAFVAVLAVRHGTTKRAKLYLLRLLVANGAALSLFGMVRVIAGATHLFGLKPSPEYFFATFSYANHAGAFFTLLFVINGGLFLQAALDVDERVHTRWLLATLILNFIGAMFSLGRASILFSWTMVFVGGAFSLVYAWPRLNLSERMRTSILGAVSVAMATLFFFFVYPQNRVREELSTIEWGGFFSRLFGDRWLQTTTALRIWEDHPWFGVGGMGYRHYVGQYLEKEKWPLLHRGTENVYNDSVQFLCEHGAIGFSLLLAAVLLLLLPLIQRLLLARHAGRDRWDGDRWLLFRVSPITLAILAATAITFLHSLIDIPFRSPAVLITWSLALACAPAFLPIRADSRVTSGKAGVQPPGNKEPTASKRKSFDL
jgi:hypothetical protein